MTLSHSALLTDPSRQQSSAAIPRACLASNHSARPIGSTVTRRAFLTKVQPRVTYATAKPSPDSEKRGAVHTIAHSLLFTGTWPSSGLCSRHVAHMPEQANGERA